MSLKVTILGSGASAGVPVVGCECAVCRSKSPKNTRTRVSVLVEKGNSRILIDASPDLRTQALRHDIRTVDAVIFTHAHADHCHGIDDLRSFNYHANAVLPAYAMPETLNELQQRFGYVFQPPPEHSWFRAALTPQPIEAATGGSIAITPDITIRPFIQQHGRIHSLGIRIDNFAYSTDVHDFPEQSAQAIENLDVWVVDCLRYEPAPSHAHLALSLSWIERYAPKRAVLTHLSHCFDYDTLKQQIPAHVEPAYDGLIIHCN